MTSRTNAADTPPAVSKAGDAEKAGALFRAEAVAEQQTMWLGTVLLAPRASHNAMVLFALTVAGLLVLLLFGSYTRTARVGGLLVSAPGLVRVFAVLCSYRHWRNRPCTRELMLS